MPGRTVRVAAPSTESGGSGAAISPVEMAHRIVRSFGSFKTIPEVALRAAELSSDPQCSFEALEEVLRRDPTLVSRLLQLVNSPFFGLASTVECIPQALMLIGLKQLRNLVLVDVAGALAMARTVGTAIPGRALWLHSTAVGVCAQMVARRMLRVAGDDAFVCGILHDIGLVLLNQVRPDELARALASHRRGTGTLRECERRELGTDHVLVGVSLSHQWSFPAAVRHAIESHHDDDLSTSADPAIAEVLAIAHHLASELGYFVIPGLPDTAPEWVLALVAEREVEFRALRNDVESEMKKADRFFRRADRAPGRSG